MKTVNEIEAETGQARLVARHPIQVVSRRTGLSSDVIRVWERRYGAVVPQRQAAGRRLYSDEDIHRLTLLQRVTSAGRRISEVAELNTPALQLIVDEDRQIETASVAPASTIKTTEQHVALAQAAIHQFDTARLYSLLTHASTELPQQIFLEQVISVLLRNIGTAWIQGDIRVGHEHMASIVVKRILSGMLGRTRNTGPLIVLTTVAGQHHEIGALIAAICAESEGWRVLYLGPDMPAEEIASTAIQTKANAVGLSLQFRCDETLLSQEMKKLRMALPESVRIIVGGSATGHYPELFKSIEAFTPQDLAEFRTMLSAS